MQIQKIHDLRKHLRAYPMNDLEFPGPRRIGVIHLRFVRFVAFFVVVLALMACAVVCVMAVWDYVQPDFAWRSLVSFGIIAAAVTIFVALNESFGPIVRGPIP